MNSIEQMYTYISQGEYVVGKEATDVITTILGSCVATCLWDPHAQIGGMNHFLLPDGGGANDESSRFGAHAMELLINDMIKCGASRNRMRAKVFGGAQLRAGLTNAGEKNARYVLEYLKKEKIPCDGSSLGGPHARRIEFRPYGGSVRQKFVSDAQVAPPAIVMPAPISDIELF
ncbi:chemotaxis protein CheD [Aliiroseovarius sp. PTFE2010]|uniref:chemotaxis protein CheD n=1 Tax=Aliiroseovarius sp. PTFE2010 TaxID=3417190 RepID=UPI003CF29076